ncbi:hypothetical protein GLOTRDRAFT_133009 [Gloeophyllum trabeum ATCC 11539]|uniref:Uncharacterized protein n=1 Tax=Gloeophyllum trabeum (strain ATCC 11539 / FP-39264 / Madison 617) TaxID=670483 RepID=S7PWD6_GLOTA|nr:uncharacterized protein GLOTRDRAFT_133009 [Gloeophyllum trabeum ATCC 11539]EPQ51637.1 hypothetical protein GLOTRDRAFT_133009 [Gloeophyllum trabeum ATCC 11539]
MSSVINPVSDVKVATYHIPRHGRYPNSDADNKPLVHYKSLFRKGAGKDAIKDHLAKVNVIQPQWTYTMYPTDHFHTTCHEAIVILSGSALLAFGGVENPRKVELEVEQGDALLIPAGMSHKQVRELGTKVFDMLGAYEIGAEHWDMCYGREEEGDTGQRIKRVGWFKQDPFYGEGGPATKL